MSANPPPPDTADDGSAEEGPFIPVEARPAVVEDLGRTAWQVSAALRCLDDPP